jgi:hypothetical protein
MRSSIPNPPANFRLREDQLSGSSLKGIELQNMHMLRCSFNVRGCQDFGYTYQFSSSSHKVLLILETASFSKISYPWNAAPRSFFSLSTFRSKGGDARLRWSSKGTRVGVYKISSRIRYEYQIFLVVRDAAILWFINIYCVSMAIHISCQLSFAVFLFDYSFSLIFFYPLCRVGLQDHLQSFFSTGPELLYFFIVLVIYMYLPLNLLLHSHISQVHDIW